MRNFLGLFFGLFLILTSCKKESANLISELNFPSSGWMYKSPEEVGMSKDSLVKALDYLKQHCGKDKLDQTIVVKNGYIVFAGDSLEVQHNIYSSTKSLTSAVLGLLIQDGTVSIDDRAAQYEPLLADRFPEVTLRHFATMTSGYSAKGDSRWGEPSADWSYTPYDPDTPLFAPGTAFAYWDEAQMMFGRVLLQAANRDLYDILDERIMKPIGVTQWGWWAEDTIKTQKGTLAPLRNGCTGIDMGPRDLARIGWLFANHGIWNGDTLLSPLFVREALKAQVSSDIPLGDMDRRSMKGSGVYGFNWWTATPSGGGALSMLDSPSDAAYMSGFNHNVCMVIPSEKLVIVRMGEDGNPPEGKSRVWNEFLKILL